MTQRKLWILGLLGLAIIAILALSASLAQLEFSPGEPFAFGTGLPPSTMPDGMGGEMSPLLKTALRVVMTVLLALVPFSILYLLFTPDGRRKLLQNLIILGIFVGLLSLLRQQTGDKEQTDLFANFEMAPPGEAITQRPPAEFSGAAPDWLVIAASIALAVIVLALIAGIIWIILRRRRPAKPSFVFEQLAQEAQNAADTIEAGGDLWDTVIRCYAEMNRVAREARGIQRQQAMTPPRIRGTACVCRSTGGTSPRPHTAFRRCALRRENAWRLGGAARGRLSHLGS